MSAVVMRIRRVVADYCNNSNRPEEKTMPGAVFLFSPKGTFLKGGSNGRYKNNN
jgi:hypothetical protein